MRSPSIRLFAFLVVLGCAPTMHNAPEPERVLAFPILASPSTTAIASGTATPASARVSFQPLGVAVASTGQASTAKEGSSGQVNTNPADDIEHEYKAIREKCQSTLQQYQGDLATASDNDYRAKTLSGAATGLLSLLTGSVAAASANNNSPSTTRSAGIATAAVGLVGTGVTLLYSPGQNTRSVVTAKLDSIEAKRKVLESITAKSGFDPAGWDKPTNSSWQSIVSDLGPLCTYKKPT